MKISRTNLKALRDVRRSKWQFLAVCVATALGVAIFVASYGSFQNLRDSYDRTYDRLLMADAWFQVEGAPETVVRALRAEPGVESAEGRLIADLPVAYPDHDLPRILTRLVSVPWEPGGPERPSVNDVSVVDGSYIGGASEVLLEQTYASFNDVRVGDRVEVVMPGAGSLDLTVAGLVVSPEYLFAARNEQEMFTPPSQFGVAFLPYDTLSAFLGMEGQVNDIAIRLTSGAEPGAVTQRVGAQLEAYGPVQVADRPSQLSNRLLQLDLDGFEGLALVFPLLFMIVAGLAVYTLLNRLMQSQRAQIGVMRAIGYGQGAVLRHYLVFGVIVGLVGAVMGVIVGWLLADVATRGYASSLDVPFVVVSANLPLIGIGFVAGLGIAIVSSLPPAWSAARILPAEAMRPPTPPRGMRSPLERLFPMVRRLPSSLKLPLRDVLRMPRRALFTALGVGAGVSLVLVASSMLDSFDSAISLQFDSIQNYDARVEFAEPLPLSWLADVRSVEGVSVTEAVAEVPARISAAGRQADVLLQGLQQDADLLRVYAPSHDRIQPGGGLLVPETLANSLGLRVGESVTMLPLSTSASPVDLLVDGFTAQPLGSVVITRLETVAAVLGQDEMSTAMLVQVDDSRDLGAFRSDMNALPEVAAVQLKQDVRDYVGQFNALFTVFVTFMLAFGVALGFVVIFNSITINVLERQRELATMRVIGVSIGKVFGILTVEHAIVGALGVLLGVPIGLAVASYFASLYQTDLIDLPLVIYTRSYLLAGAGALLTVLLAEIPALWFVRRLDLPQATKELTS